MGTCERLHASVRSNALVAVISACARSSCNPFFPDERGDVPKKKKKKVETCHIHEHFYLLETWAWSCIRRPLAATMQFIVPMSTSTKGSEKSLLYAPPTKGRFLPKKKTQKPISRSFSHHYDPGSWALWLVRTKWLHCWKTRNWRPGNFNSKSACDSDRIWTASSHRNQGVLNCMTTLQILSYSDTWTFLCHRLLLHSYTPGARPSSYWCTPKGELLFRSPRHSGNCTREGWKTIVVTNDRRSKVLVVVPTGSKVLFGYWCKRMGSTKWVIERQLNLWRASSNHKEPLAFEPEARWTPLNSDLPPSSELEGGFQPKLPCQLLRSTDQSHTSCLGVTKTSFNGPTDIKRRDEVHTWSASWGKNEKIG